MTSEQPTSGVNVTLFCRVMKALQARHPKRAVDQTSMNRLVNMVAELDRVFGELPTWKSVAKESRP